MIERNIVFNINEDGNSVKCFVLAYKSINDSEVNILFSQDNDEADTIRYGKMIKNDNDFILSNNISLSELDELKQLLDVEIRNLAFKIAKPGVGDLL